MKVRHCENGQGHVIFWCKGFYFGFSVEFLGPNLVGSMCTSIFTLVYAFPGNGRAFTGVNSPYTEIFNPHEFLGGWGDHSERVFSLAAWLPVNGPIVGVSPFLIPMKLWNGFTLVCTNIRASWDLKYLSHLNFFTRVLYWMEFGKTLFKIPKHVYSCVQFPSPLQPCKVINIPWKSLREQFSYFPLSDNEIRKEKFSHFRLTDN